MPTKVGNGLDLEGRPIIDVADPTNPQDAATRAWVLQQLADLVGGAPTTLDTLNEIAEALNDDAGVIDTILASLAAKTTKYAQAVGDGAATSIVVTHNLNTRDVLVALYEASGSFVQWLPDVEHTSVNTITLKFGTAPAAGAFRVVVIG